MPGLSEEDARRFIASAAKAREQFDAWLVAHRHALGPDHPAIREAEDIRDGYAAEVAILQTLAGPEEHGPAQVVRLEPRDKSKRGAHRA